MREKDPHIQTFIQGLRSEHYRLANKPITGTWNNAGDEILRAMYRRQRRIEQVRAMKGASFVLAFFALGGLALWLI